MGTFRRGTIVVLLAPALLLASACSPAPDLVGPTWVLEEEAETGAGGLVPVDITVTFKEDGTVTGFYSQLNYAGSYVIDGGALTIDDICWLSLICQAETNMSGPESFVETLERADRFSIERDTLTIYAGEDTLTFLPAE